MRGEKKGREWRDVESQGPTMQEILRLNSERG